MQKLSIDIVGPLPRTQRGHTHILTVKDLFTRWVEAFPLSQPTTRKVADKLVAEVFLRFGPPEALHADNATCFDATMMQELAELLHIWLTFSLPYSPKPNPVERMHRDLNTLLRVLVRVTPIGGRRPSHMRSSFYGPR